MPSAAENDAPLRPLARARDGALSVRFDERFELSREQICWDDAMSLLGAIWDAPQARAVVCVRGGATLAIEWASLEAIDAVGESVALRFPGLNLLITAGRCDQIMAERWDHGLCRAVVFTLGDTVLSVQASWWQHR